jgi:hypothetical protein
MLKFGITCTAIGLTAILATAAGLAIGAPVKPGYALEAYNSHTGDVHVMDHGLTYSDCLDALDERRARWGTAIRWSCEYHR